MVTATDDGWIRTHDDVEALLRYAALGATVVFGRIRSEKNHSAIGASREFTVVMDAAPHHAVNGRDIYTLPCKAPALAKRVVDLCDRARRDLPALSLQT